MGDLGISPAVFYKMSVHEVTLAIQGKDDALVRDYNLMLIACVNGNGLFHGGKKFKVINPFEVKEKNKPKKKPTKQERAETIAFLQSFNK